MSFGQERRLRTSDTPGRPDQGALTMRKLIALVFHYSLNGLLADEGTEYYRWPGQR